MKSLLLLSSILTASCFSGGEECRLPLDEGTWKASYTWLDGNCGWLPDEVLQFPSELPSHCTRTKEVVTDDCTYQQTTICETDDMILQTVSSVEQIEFDYLYGTFGIILIGSEFSCSGTYRIEAVEL